MRPIPRKLRPGQIMILGFAGVMLIGTAVLSLPAMTPAAAPLGTLDALFTSASSLCVTGLVVRDTGADFTFAGQFVILILIQIGGLGIMSITGVTSLMLGRGISIRDAGLLRELFAGETLSEAGRIVRFIVTMSLAIEAVGALSLYLVLGPGFDGPGGRLWSATFHAVSAFCNAGFCLDAESLVPLAANGAAVGVIGGLLVIGGLGFVVLANLMAWSRGRLMRPVDAARGHARRRDPVRLTVQTRIVLLVSALLLAGGALLLALPEWNGSLAGMAPAQKIQAALFQSATARTAGFNTVDLDRLGDAALLVMIVLMFVGAAPGSTGGGLKVTTLAVLWANLRAIAAGGRKPRIFDREIGGLLVRRSFVVFSSYVAACTLGVFCLLLTESGDFLETLFEAVSALGTVGLSLGMTPDLTPLGKGIVIALMFMGRLGPLALAVYLVHPEREHDIRYPEATITIG